MDSTCLVICTERGRIEAQSLLLVASLRQNGGAMKDCPIVSFSPRKDYLPSGSTLRALEKLNVEVNTLPINNDFVDYPVANKLLATSYIEQNTSYKNVVMLDSDIVFLAPPELFLLADGCDIALRPVHNRNIATLWGESPGSSWVRLFEELPQKTRMKTKTTVENIDIEGYWNAGMVVCRRDLSFFSTVLERLSRLASKVRFTGTELYFRDQMIIAASIMHDALRVSELPSSYNYPFKQNVCPEHRISNLDNIVALHYHRRFDKQIFSNPINTDFEPGKRRDWLDTMVEAHGLRKDLWRRVYWALMRKITS